MAKRKKNKQNKKALNLSTHSTRQKTRQGGFSSWFAGMGVQPVAGARTEMDTPNWLVYLALAWYPAIAILGVYGHKYGYSPDLHMASLIQVGGAVLLTMLVGLRTGLNSKGLALYRPGMMLPAILFVGWAILSMLWAVNLYEASFKILDWGGAVMAGLITSYVIRTREDVRFFLNAVLVVGGALLFLGFMQYLYNVQWVDQHAAPSMTFNNKNMAAQYTLMFLPIGIGMALCARSWIASMLYLSVSFLAICFIALTVTRGAIVGLAAQLAVICFLFGLYGLKHKIKAMQFLVAMMVALTVIAIAVAFTLYPDTIKYLIHRFSIAITEYRLESRFPIWLNTVEMIRDHLFIGVGAGNWMVFYPKYHLVAAADLEIGLHKQHINTHQDYLEIFAELGVVGFGLWIWLLLFAVWATLRLVWTMKSQDVFLVVAMAAAVAGLAANSLVSFGMQQPLPVCMYVIYIAMIGYYWRVERQTASSWVYKPKSIANLPVIVCVVLSVSLAILHYAWYTSEVHYRQALSSTNNTNVMVYHAEQSLRWAPGRTRTLNFMAKAYADKGDANNAIAAYDQLLEDYPYMMHAIDNAASGYRRYGRLEKARELYKRVLEIRTTPYMYARTGELLYTMGYYAEGAEYIRYALQNRGQGVRQVYRKSGGLTEYTHQRYSKMLAGYDARNKSLKAAQERSAATEAQTDADTKNTDTPVSASGN